MADGSIGMSGHNFDAFVSSQRPFNDYDLAAKIQEKYWRARQKFLSKIEKKEDSCIVLSDSKLDAKLEIYRSIDKSCAKLTNILDNYQNCLYVYANDENSLGILLKECSKHDKTKAGKIMAMAGKSLTQASHQRIKLYMPLMRLHQEMETFHSRAVNDTSETVSKLESKRSQYRASLLWMKDVSEQLNPDVYSQLDRFRRIQSKVRDDKKVFDNVQMDVVQKIDLLMASRCNLLNQILAAYQSTLLETFEKNSNNFKSIEELIKKEDIYEYEFKTLKQLNPLKLSDSNDGDLVSAAGAAVETPDQEAADTGLDATDLLDLANDDDDGDADDASQFDFMKSPIINKQEEDAEEGNAEKHFNEVDLLESTFADDTANSDEQPKPKKPSAMDLLELADSEEEEEEEESPKHDAIVEPTNLLATDDLMGFGLDGRAHESNVNNNDTNNNLNLGENNHQARDLITAEEDMMTQLESLFNAPQQQGSIL